MTKKKPRIFCIHCYTTEAYFIRKGDRIQRRCLKCNRYIKWSPPSEYQGHEIRNNPAKLF